MPKKQKLVFFLGSKRQWDEVYEYYAMIVDAFNKYCDNDEKLTPSRKQYMIYFKNRVDSVAKLLGIPSGAFLPKGVDKNYTKPEEENNTNEEYVKESDQADYDINRTEGISDTVRIGRANRTSSKKNKVNKQEQME